MEVIILRLIRWVLSKFAPDFHVHHNPRKTVVVNFPEVKDGQQ